MALEPDLATRYISGSGSDNSIFVGNSLQKIARFEEV
jgi:hypothetical protein